MHTKGTQRENRIFDKILIFNAAKPHICGSKNVPCVCAPDKIFFPRNYKHIPKNFYYYNFAKYKTLLYMHMQTTDQLNFQKTAVLSQKSYPPNETKSSKFLMLPATCQIYIIKNFQVYACSFQKKNFRSGAHTQDTFLDPQIWGFAAKKIKIL